MLVFTLLKSPRAKNKDYVSTAAQLGLRITERAVEKRFTPQLVVFLRQVLRRVLQAAVVALPVDTPLLKKFTAVFVGDSTTIRLPDECAAEFPGCGGTSNAGKAALKIQVLWDLCTGKLTRLLIEPGRSSDAQSAVIEATPPVGSLSIWDLGDFGLKRFQAWTAQGAYWISRLHPGTVVLDPDGRPWDLRQRLRQHLWEGPLDIAVLLGSEQRVPSRLIALRAPKEVAARRRQKAYEKAQKSGRTPTAEHLEWCDWTIFVTNCPESLLTWQEVVVLYRSRWQIELMFKLWKSHNLLATHAGTKSVSWQMAEFWAKLIGVIVQHWLLLTTTWLDHRRSLMRAAAVLRDWLALLMDALEDRDRLSAKLTQMQAAIAAIARINIRRKKPSWFQLLSNPLLLEYSY
jgi:Transposase DDE domain